jgi:hypothetical protein
MRLTIVPSDFAVYVGGVPYAPLDTSSVPVNVHALQWFDTSGWIEYVDAPNEQITELPLWAVACVEEWEAADYRRKHPAPQPLTPEDNKNKALKLLSETDWTALPEVSDPLRSDPYLDNAAAFSAYRSALRNITVNPRFGDMVWPEKPAEDWHAPEKSTPTE